VTELEVLPGDGVRVPCIGFFGNLAACGDDCDIGWIHHPFNLSDFNPVIRNTSQRVYADKQIT